MIRYISLLLFIGLAFAQDITIAVLEFEGKGAIIALEDDLRLRRALQVSPLVEFYRYEIQFRLNRE